MLEDYFYISTILQRWYSINKRELPWRDTKEAYKIWLSEIILQQTRVAQGYDYYLRFIEAFPTVEALATAKEDVVMKLWQGLGYYSRARNLHEAAKVISIKYKGEFPSAYQDILSLKGVGDYTAAAIASFAFDLPYAVVDGNVFRVISRLFAIETPIDSAEGKKIFRDFANLLLDKSNPANHNQSIMEFGALQCVPSSPNCTECPLSDICAAYLKGGVANFPVKKGKTQVKERYFNYIDIRINKSLFLRKRTGNDIWKNLYELPLIETEKPLLFEELVETDAFKKLIQPNNHFKLKSSTIYLKHVLSHRLIHANFYKIEIEDSLKFDKEYIKIKESDLHDYAISRLVDKYFESDNTGHLFS